MLADWRLAMRANSGLLKINSDTIVNLANVAYIELTAKGGADIHFVGKTKAVHLNANEAERLRDYIAGEKVIDITEAA
jgi:hypothetical protein